VTPAQAPAGWDRFNRLPLYGRVLLIAFGAMVTLELFLLLTSGLGGGSGQGGPSSYSTRENGLAAYAELLTSSGHQIERSRATLDELDLPNDATLIVAESPLSDAESLAAEDLVDRGGRVVFLGPQPGDVMQRMLAARVEWTAGEPGEAIAVIPVPETAGVNNVASEEWSALEETGPAVPVLAVGDDVVAAVAQVGDGRVVLVGTAAPLLNAGLALADNAAFGLAIAGPAERPVYFAEAGHTGSSGSGLGALPREWKWALVIGLLATFLAMWSAGRRFGPPEDDASDLPPPRKAYVDAVAATLLKTKQPDASLAPLRRAARERVARKAVLPPDADEEQLRRAAAQLGLPPDEIDALFGAVTTDDKALAVGRAMARLGGTKW
jgi:Domain of unknown function (DUF4350)